MNFISMAPDSLNGKTNTASLFSFLADLIYYSKQYPDHDDLKEMIKVFKETYAFAVEANVVKSIIDDRDKAMRRKQFCEKIRKKLKSLKDGERFVYVAGVNRHALMYEFRCRIDSRGSRVYDFKIINSITKPNFLFLC